MYREITESVFKLVGVSRESVPDYDAFLERTVRILERRLGEQIVPKHGESLAISFKPKTAALAFDRIYRIPVLIDAPPLEIGFYCATRPEVALIALAFVWSALSEVGVAGIKEYPKGEGSSETAVLTLRLMCAEMREHFQIVPTIIYESQALLEKDYPAGPQQVLNATIDNISIVDEKKLTWKQVVEFRRDVEARRKYQRLVRWVDAELKARTANEVADLLAIRLDDYEWSLKKHGLKATIGTLGSLVDPKFIGATSAATAAAAFAAGGIWGALAGTALVIGRATATFGTELIDGFDERRKNNFEVAYVHEIKKKLGEK